MVVWVFAGGGETELKGLIIFLSRNFPLHRFIRKTPIRKKHGPRPGIHAFGHTGVSLLDQINYFLPIAFRQELCDLILVIDDLDCQDSTQRSVVFEESIRNLCQQVDIHGFVGEIDLSQVSCEIAFAAPEIEGWLIADWGNTFARDPDIRNCQIELRRELIKEYRRSAPGIGDIQYPETFSQYDLNRGTCQEKLSEKIQQIVFQLSGINYSKAEHSGRMLAVARARQIFDKCPNFRGMYRRLIEPNQ